MESLNEEQLIARLSQMHKQRSRDPQVLCQPSLFQFDMGNPDFKMIFTWQPALTEICLKRGDEWTKKL